MVAKDIWKRNWGGNSMEWKEVTLGEIGTIVGGATPSTKNTSFYDGNIPWLTPKDLSVNSNKYILRGERNITEAGFKSCSCKMLPKGSVLFSSRAPIGYVAITANDMCTNQGFKSVIPNEETDSEFLYYLLKYNKDNIASQGSGTTFAEVSGKTMKEIEVMVPKETDDQHRIASILSSLDRKIELNNKINADLEEMAQAIFKNWLSECTDEVTIGELSLNVTNYEKTNAEKVVLINSSDVTEGYFDHHNYSPNKNLKGHFKKRFQKGDILYSQVRPRNRHWAYCNFEANDYLASTQLMVIRNNPSLITSILLYQYIISDNVWKEFTLKTETRSGTFPQGNYEDLSQIRVPYNSDVEGISNQLDTLYAKMFMLEKENSRLSLLRDTLLPRLMSGELEVPE